MIHSKINIRNRLKIYFQNYTEEKERIPPRSRVSNEIKYPPILSVYSISKMATFLSIPTRRSHARWGEWFSPRPLLRGMKLTGTITGPCNVPHGDTVNRSTLYEPQWIPDGNRPLDLSIHSAPSIFPLSTSCPIHVSILVNLDSRRQPWYGVV